MTKSVFYREENIAGKGENCGYYYKQLEFTTHLGN